MGCKMSEWKIGTTFSPDFPHFSIKFPQGSIKSKSQSNQKCNQLSGWKKLVHNYFSPPHTFIRMFIAFLRLCFIIDLYLNIFSLSMDFLQFLTIVSDHFLRIFLKLVLFLIIFLRFVYILKRLIAFYIVFLK